MNLLVITSSASAYSQPVSPTERPESLAAYACRGQFFRVRRRLLVGTRSRDRRRRSLWLCMGVAAKCSTLTITPTVLSPGSSSGNMALRAECSKNQISQGVQRIWGIPSCAKSIECCSVTTNFSSPTVPILTRSFMFQLSFTQGSANKLRHSFQISLRQSFRTPHGLLRL
jgi:hypothetical protein